MSRLGSNYDIAKPTGTCAATGEPLTPGQPCIAVLVESEADESLIRLDYALNAWPTDEAARPKGLFSFWKTTVPEPNTRRKTFADDDLLINLFERLADDDRPQRINFRFILALVLVRKKILKVVGTRTEPTNDQQPQEILLVQQRTRADEPDAETVEVINPRLSDDDARAVSDQLGEILNGDLE